METIEKRAREFCDKISVGQDVPNYIKNFMIECYRAGADSEHTLLTEWHDPTEHPKSGLTVLTKCIDVRFPNQPFFAVGVYYAGTKQWALDCYGTNKKVIGWREIHE